MGRKHLVVCIMLTILVTTNAEATSETCVYINGQTKCVSKTDPYGNVATGSASIINGQGTVSAGAGTQGNINTDYQQIGNGEAGNGDYQPIPGQGGMNVAVGSGTGAGFPFNPAFPPLERNPFKFVENFFKGLNRYNGGGVGNGGFQPGPGLNSYNGGAVGNGGFQPGPGNQR